MNVKKTAISLAIFVSSGLTTIYADETETECELVQTETVSLYYMALKTNDDKIGDYYQEKIDLINNMAKKAGWKNYQMTSQDVSVSNSGYGYSAEILDVNVSINIQFDADYEALSLIASEAGAYSMSASRYGEASCVGDSY
ncbi:hypothetical protein [Reinekea sp.]|uniref:hypothetical protein n=1 Tax=Reinekea sp. TaxID=1970455 RepID=UPI00398930CF